jgi:hypothetical protein
MDLAVWTVATNSLRLDPQLEAELPRVFAEDLVVECQQV